MTLHDLHLHPLNGNPEPTASSWTPKDLTTLPDQPPIKPNLGGIGIVYPGKRHAFSGAPESAKTLAAYCIGINTIRQGGTIILIDFEMGEYDARDRLYELGATRDEISRGVQYIEPDTPATIERIQTLAQLQPQLVIIDAAAGAYDLQGLDDNKRKDVEQLSRLYTGIFWRKRIASILIDHVVKNAENRGKFSIGSERKLGGVDVHLGFETIQPIQRGKNGLYKIVTHKDRGGYLTRGHLANLELESDPISHQIEWTFLRPAPDTAPEGYFRPTHLMEKASLYLEKQPEPVVRNAVAAALGGKKKWALDALHALILEGFVAETEGDGRTKPVHTIRPYRENDPACNPETDEPEDPTGAVLASSRLVPISSQPVPEPDEDRISSPQGTGSRLVPGTDEMIGSRSSSLRSRELGKPSHPDQSEQAEWFPVETSWLDTLDLTDIDLDQQAGTLDQETP